MVIIATYLTFFPVTIAADARPALAGPARAGADALVRGVALEHLLEGAPAGVGARTCSPALKIAATASIVGAIIGEGPGGIQAGLGRAIIVYFQQYITGP